MSEEMCRLNSTVFASAKGRQSRQPPGAPRDGGRQQRPGLVHANHRACADDDRRRSLGGGRLRHTAHPHVSQTAVGNAGSSIILTGSLLIVRTLQAALPTSVLATDGPVRSCIFIPGSRMRTRRQVAGHSPSAFCPIVASCIVIIHNKKRWRRWAGRCPAKQCS
jgi:hypothetical protein